MCVRVCVGGGLFVCFYSHDELYASDAPSASETREEMMT